MQYRLIPCTAIYLAGMQVKVKWLCRYCLPCILHWASIESSCPLCKAQFTKVSQRPILLGANTRSRKDLALERLGPVVHVHDIEERHQVLLALHCRNCPACLPQQTWNNTDIGHAHCRQPVGDKQCFMCIE